jgi:predicted dehydrogenase
VKIGFELDYIPQYSIEKKWNIGIIGSGFIIKECHLPAYQNAGYQISGTTSRSYENAKKAADQFGLPRAYSSIDELLNDPSVDIVDIAVPPHLQKDIIRKAARHGKHILAQKPVATNYLDAKEIVDICEEAGVNLIVNQNGRFDPAIRATKDLIDKGYIGKPVLSTIQLRFKPHWQPYQKEYERLMFLFMSIHHLDQFRYWFGTPDRIYASAVPHPSGDYKGEYLGAYNLEYDSGFLATAVDDGYTWDEPDFGVYYKIVGTDGVIKLNVGWPSGGPSKIKFYSKQLGDVWYTPNLSGSWFPDAFKYTMAELQSSLETGAESSISGRNNLETMAMVEACYLSSQQKRAISIHEIMSGLASK